MKTSRDWLSPPLNCIILHLFIYKNHNKDLKKKNSGSIWWIFRLALVLQKKQRERKMLTFRFLQESLELYLNPYYASSAAIHCFLYYFIKKKFRNEQFMQPCHSKHGWFFFLQWIKKCKAEYQSFKGREVEGDLFLILQTWWVVISHLTNENQTNSYGIGMKWGWVNERNLHF